jgi:2-polyprenyl-6-methoxyphenol hydroxylase-like FAD-dependent oxidoreductase
MRVTQVDVVIVGGGIGGGALAANLAGAGLDVLVLEKSTVYRDHVRGEWIAPWGVVELKRLGLYDAVCAGGGHHLARHRTCEEEMPAEMSELMELNLAAMVADIPGPLCIGHPALCQLFIEQAAQAGAAVRRDVTEVQIALGQTPAVEYRHAGTAQRTSCRLIVGADGRGSLTRRQAGIELYRDPTHHHFAGMLVEGADGWPADLQVIGSAGDVFFLVFPQGGGRVRLYLGYATGQAKRFAGAQAPQAFLDAFRLACQPRSEHIAGARPAGPCNSYPNEDTWTDAVSAPGIVLIGDAAGSNDPIIGQGLSITLRDVRLVRDALLAERAWSPGLFEPYAVERAERMRRLRFTASVIAALQNEFGPAARARRQRVREAQMEDPTLGLPLLSTLMGPDAIPAEAFEEPLRARLLA